MAANANVGFGFRVAFQYGGSPPNYALNERTLAYNESSVIAFGDPVYMTSTGNVDLMAVGGTTVHGIAAGVTYANPSAVGGITFSNQWAAPSGLSSSTVPKLKVYNDPTTVFMVQYIGTALTIDAVGNNVDITSGTSGVPNGAGISTCTVGTPATTATYPFKIIGIVGLGAYEGYPSPIPNYNPTYDNQFLFVKMNTSDLVTALGI